VAIAKDRTTKVEVRIPNHAVLDYTLGHAMESTENDWQLAPDFNFDVKRGPRMISFKFDFNILKDDDGAVCFNRIPHYAISKVVITPINGDPPFQASLPIDVRCSGHGMCGKCFGKGHLNGEPHQTRDCPLNGACKMCWEMPDPDKAFAVHLKKSCSVAKQLEALARQQGESIFPFTIIGDTTTIASQGQGLFGQVVIPEERLTNLRTQVEWNQLRKKEKNSRHQQRLAEKFKAERAKMQSQTPQ